MNQNSTRSVEEDKTPTDADLVARYGGQVTDTNRAFLVHKWITEQEAAAVPERAAPSVQELAPITSELAEVEPIAALPIIDVEISEPSKDAAH
jgi:hypothetical protein